MRLPKAREISPGPRRRTYLAALLPVVVTVVAFCIVGGLARDIAPILVDHFRYWRRELTALAKAARVLWRR